jgi:hypothetical protein
MLDRGENLSLALDCNQPPAFDFPLEVERLYAALIPGALAIAGAGPIADAEPGLGGKLLYAGELDPQRSALVVAANIAGAASLAATAGAPAQKQAVRDGVVDFLVTSLDEALRILKNQIRKRETVAVCVAASPQAIEQQMLERGVLPALLPPHDASAPQYAEFLALGARRVELPRAEQLQAVLTWSVASAPAQWLPRLDVIALECLNPGDWTARRWLRLAPRYLGRRAQDVRVLSCEPGVAKEFVARVQRGVNSREIGVEVRICMSSSEDTFLFQPSPSAVSEDVD